MKDRVDGVPGEEFIARLRSRSEFLKIMSAAGIAVAIGPHLLTRHALAFEPPAPTDTSFSFPEGLDYSAFDVISDAFVDHDDKFATNTLRNYTVLSPTPERQRGRASIESDVLSVKNNGNTAFFALFRTNKIALAPYAAVIVDVKSFSSSASKENSVYAGLIKDDENYVMAWYNDATKKAGFDVVVKGTINRLAETDVTLRAPVRFAFVLNSKEITALADEGDGWKPVANYPNEPTEFNGVPYPDPATAPGLSGYVDLRDPAVLAKYRYGFGVRGDSGTIALDRVEAGYWGRAGVRDPHVVTYADGTPYITKDNKLYLTLTNAGLDFFSTAHWGLYTLDLSNSNYASPTALKEVGKLFFERDGKVMGDHAGHIVYDDSAGNFLIGVSTWGDFTYNGVDIYYTREPKQKIEDLHGVHVLEAKKLPLPTPYSSWDPHFALIGGQWYVAFVESPTQGNPWQHYPALSKGSTIENLTLVARKGVPGEPDQGLRQTEGMVIQKVGDNWYVLCSTGRGDNTYENIPPPAYRIYNLDMNLVGTLNAFYETNIPHPMITPLPDLPGKGDTTWIMLTFNETFFYFEILDYGTHGNFVVMDGPTWEGYEQFPPREPPA